MDMAMLRNLQGVHAPLRLRMERLTAQKVGQGFMQDKIKLPVTHVLVDTWMLTVKLVYELSDVPDDLKWTTKHI